MMNDSNNDEVLPETCRNHSARSEREISRVCPSKLSKKELEDLYYTLLNDNMQLKKTVNSQQDKIKILSTKVQRMTASQKGSLSREQKDCCTHTKALVNEHKESISELKKANERLSDRVRVLNMRLCSAKQFMRKSPSTSVKCIGPGLSAKTSLSSIVNTKRSENNIQSAAETTEKKLMSSTNIVETPTNDKVLETPEKGVCDENKCQTLMEELKHKIVYLQEELSKTHEDYSTRISRLESDVSGLRDANVRVRSECSATARLLQQRAHTLADELRTADANYGTLTAQLLVEQKKVAELEAMSKLMPRCSPGSMEQHLQATEEMKTEIEKEPAETVPLLPQWEKKVSRELNEQNTDLLNKISQLQDQLATLTSKKDMVDSSKQNGRPCSPASDNTKSNLVTSDRENNDKETGKQNYLTPDNWFPLSMPTKTDNVDNFEPTSSAKAKSSFSRSPNTGLEPQGNDASTEETNINSTPENSRKFTGKIDHNTQANQSDFNFSEKVNDIFTHNSVSGGNDFDFIDKQGSQKISQYEMRNGKKMTSSLGFQRDNADLTDLDKKDKLKYSSYKSEVLPHKGSQSVKKHADSTDTTNASAVMQKMLDGPSRTDIPKEEMNYFHKIQIADDVNSELENDETKRDSLIKADNDNRQQIPGPLPVDKSQVKPYVKNTDKTIGPKFKQFIKNNKRVLNNNEQSETKDRNSDVSFARKSDAINNAEEIVDDQNISLKDLHKNKDGFADNTSLKWFIEDNGKVTDKNVDRDAENATAKVAPHLELCEQYARVCGCPGSVRERAVFRNCSGSQQFNSISQEGTRFKLCQCFNEEPLPKDSDTQTDRNPPENEQPYRQRSLTYTKEEKGNGPPQYRDRRISVHHRSFGTSPDNTEAEISSLSDLPTEGDGKSPRTLSPGQHKATSTTESSPRTDLSDGEVLSSYKDKDLSYGETKVNFASSQALSSQRMEQALQAIGVELARCRRMLQEAEGKPPTKDAGQMAGRRLTGVEPQETVPLRPAAGCERLADSYCDKCTFTLHIGTVVLSDEAVVNSRDMSLVLSWKFFDQNVAMTRMRAGRVVLFDFSTQYDIKVTQQFLDYLKNDEMSLVISEVDHQDEPYARCALPLRDSLLHVNRRADMSLALIAGPKLREVRAARDDLDSGDEVGVLDLWCMLKVDHSLLPALNKAIAQGGATPMCLPTDLQYSGSRLAETQSGRGSVAAPSSHLKDNVGSIMASFKETSSQAPYPGPLLPETERNMLQNVPKLRERDASFSSFGSAYKRQSMRQPSQVGFMVQDEIHTPSIMLSEMPTQIRTSEDLRRVYERFSGNDELPPNENQHKLEEDPSETHSTVSSWRGLVTRRLLTKRSMKESIDSLVDSSAKEKPSNERKGKSKKLSDTKIEEWNGIDRPSQKGFLSAPKSSVEVEELPELEKNTSGYNRTMNASKKSVTIAKDFNDITQKSPTRGEAPRDFIQITVMWLALNEECDAMINPKVQRLYVAYSFLGKGGAELETPVSLPKPKSYYDKCTFNFTKTFYLTDMDIPVIRHLARCRSSREDHDVKDCIVFSVISEPPEDPLGLEECEDIGYAYVFLGDILAYSAGSNVYMEVVPVHARDAVCGVLAVRVEGLHAVRTLLPGYQND